jgi:error-prone DNA polymerase
MRAKLAALGLPDAHEVSNLPHGRRVRYAGLVIVRQRPGTAKGVVFMTLEDETGFVNVVLWKDVFARYALLAKTSAFLGVTGKIQRESDVVHIVGESLWEPGSPRERARTRSRDFH